MDMKMTVKALVMLIMVGLFTQACNDDDETTSAGITTDEAADEVGLTISTDVADLASDLSVVADDAENGRAASNGRTASCGVQYDTTFTRAYTGVFISYDYVISYGYMLSCTPNNVPSLLEYTFSSDGQRSTARLSSTGESTGSLTASGLEFSENAYTLNGTFGRSHTLSQNAGAQRVFNSESEVSVTDLVVNKATQRIESGSASFTVSGQGSGGASYSFTATVTFNGNGTATATIQSVVYLIDIATGEVTRQ
jgi:hypothetical protein